MQIKSARRDWRGAVPGAGKDSAEFPFIDGRHTGTRSYSTRIEEAWPLPETVIPREKNEARTFETSVSKERGEPVLTRPFLKDTGSANGYALRRKPNSRPRPPNSSATLLGSGIVKTPVASSKK